MPDITMCKDEKCPLKKSCYRHEAEADEYWQSFFSESPRLLDDSCEYYWPPRWSEVFRLENQIKKFRLFERWEKSGLLGKVPNESKLSLCMFLDEVTTYIKENPDLEERYPAMMIPLAYRLFQKGFRKVDLYKMVELLEAAEKKLVKLPPAWSTVDHEAEIVCTAAEMMK